MSRRAILFALVLAAGCGDNGQSSMFDAGADFSITPQVTHIGPNAVTCCLQTRGADFAMYLSNPSLGTIEATGRELPSHGELHLATPFGADFVIDSNVPAGGYAFSPNGMFAIFMSPTTKGQYALKFATLEKPDLQKPTVITVIPAGLDDAPLNQIAFFTPSGRYLVIGVLPKNVMNSADLHIVDTHVAADIYTLDKGAFSYQELVAGDDTMIYQNSTASTVAGQPSVEGLYFLNLAAAGSGANGAGAGRPSLIDQHITSTTLMADGHTLLYTRANRELMLFDLRDKSLARLAQNVAALSVGPGRKGPIAYIGTDRSVHVVPRFQPEVNVLPPASIDIFSPLSFSPDGSRMYFFSTVVIENNRGVMEVQRIGASTPPRVIGSRVSTRDQQFINGQMVYLDQIDATGDTGTLWASDYDGNHASAMASGVSSGNVQIAQPAPIEPGVHGIFNGPRDLGVLLLPPVFATLTGSQRDATKRTMNGSRALTGTLSFGPAIGQPMGPVDPSVHDGAFEFSDDGYVLVYAGGAVWSDTATNYVGKLTIMPTLIDVGVVTPTLSNVSELSPIVNRQFFALAPAAPQPGLYFIDF